MNLIVICLLAAASMSMLPSRVDGGAPSTTDVKSAAPVAAAATVGEIWQEDDREVLIRNVRGAKNKDAQTGTTASGKGKGKGHRKNGGKPKEQQQQQPIAHHRQHKNSKQNTSPVHDETNRKTHAFLFVFSHLLFIYQSPTHFPLITTLTCQKYLLLTASDARLIVSSIDKCHSILL